MTGTILLTGANGSAGLHAAEQLLKHHSEFTAIFTVRDAGADDINTQNLRQLIARYPEAKATVHQLDHANLASVHEFANKISAAIAAGEYPPLGAIVCNASYWNMVLDSELTADGYDKTIQVNHIAHVALVLRLLGSFADEGRIVLLSSIAHYRQPNAMTSHLPEIPDDIDQLNHPPPDKDRQGRGFQRYANSKLLITTWMYPLNRYLQKNPKFKNITAVAINPGGLADSRAFTSNTPRSIQLLQTFIVKPFMGVINRLADPTLRSSAAAGVDLAELAVNKAHPGERGYFTMLKKDESDPLTLDEGVQEKVWKKSLEWAHITKDDTALKEAFE
ncbi:hypothetical protein PFICI_13512 [Pestalotiopsis fici W106-1]|uniref:3beta-hydroxysteroid 3-dehydrogenase n=1 Tax=Pestalotiopsis fici (strain W106-1 / CGMCC3.15140) TaxID=1229662 RepID=W3WMC8_PESFW|nr:uncharacterized protein PFICI_13512 [Pestalotiopsis fici W106-1]ETS75028.1 hypothetical protein PFICI_13512 [Pestalotiopsis fici W106-1]